MPNTRARARSLCAGASILALLIACQVALAPPVGATEPADGIIKGAVYDLDRVEQQLEGLDRSSQAKVRRVLNALSMAEERLAGSANQDDPSWIEAQARVEAYRRRIAGDETQPAPTTEASAPAAVIDRFSRLVGHYNMDAPQLQKVTAADLDDAGVRRKWQQKIAFYESEMAAFSAYLGEPAVAQMDANVKSMAAWYHQLEGSVMAAIAALGDIDATIAQMQARYDRGQLPSRLDPPYELQAIKDWAEAIQAKQRQAEEDKAWLERLLATTETRAFDARNLVEGSIGTALPTAIERAVEATRSELLDPVGGLDEWVERVVSIDLADTHAVRNNLDGERFDDMIERIGDAIRRLETSKLIGQALGQTIDPQADARIASFAQSRDQIQAMHNTTIAGARMPAANSADPELLQTAEAILAEPRYGYAWKRMVINYAPKRKSETKAWWDADLISIATYEWDEYQVATAERTEDGHAVFYNELRFYHRADPTVPTGRWILHNRFKGATILEENIEG